MRLRFCFGCSHTIAKTRRALRQTRSAAPIFVNESPDNSNSPAVPIGANLNRLMPGGKWITSLIAPLPEVGIWKDCSSLKPLPRSNRRRASQLPPRLCRFPRSNFQPAVIPSPGKIISKQALADSAAQQFAPFPARTIIPIGNSCALKAISSSRPEWPVFSTSAIFYFFIHLKVASRYSR